MIGNAALFDLGLTSFWARVLVIVPVVSAASLAVGWAFHHAVERRFMGPPPQIRWTLGRRSPTSGALVVKPA
jgi:hypothetical protein